MDAPYHNTFLLHLPHLKVAQLLDGQGIGHVEQLPHVLIPFVLFVRGVGVSARPSVHLLLLRMMLMLMQLWRVRRMRQLLWVSFACMCVRIQLLALLHTDEIAFVLDEQRLHRVAVHAERWLQRKRTNIEVWFKRIVAGFFKQRRLKALLHFQCSFPTSLDFFSVLSTPWNLESRVAFRLRANLCRGKIRGL